ncbi:hypothetical protein [Marinifilum flexuosum]|uniref:Uncharacterized protein n=1 Tax=Marinifilum flexuosum TaxID=1117708 RepID=A0A419X3M9_9BACT|nr:hypothetical protein [Marinifilum flexuosum]RKE02312.1 hypothetical protein BXY64_2400 [Marinifilum flexuosum]
MDEQIVRYPFGEASQLSLSASGAQDLEIVNSVTVVDGATVEATADRTINLTIDENAKVGDRILFKVKTNATEKTIFGSGITGVTIDGVAGKTKTIEFVFDGAGFVPAGAPVQID